MTKKLLIALLIASLSATAKAEPVVYVCSSENVAEIRDGGIRSGREVRFKLFIDQSQQTVKLSEESFGTIIVDAVNNSDIQFWSKADEAESHGFTTYYKSTEDEEIGLDSRFLVSFQAKTLAITWLGTVVGGGMIHIDSLIADCEDA